METEPKNRPNLSPFWEDEQVYERAKSLAISMRLTEEDATKRISEVHWKIFNLWSEGGKLTIG